MRSRFPSEFLRSLRNDLPIDDVIRFRLALPAKRRDGGLRFLCPLCGEFDTATKRETNLARCFRCCVNFNPIDLVMAARRCAFVEAIEILAPLLKQRKARGAAKREEMP